MWKFHDVDFSPARNEERERGPGLFCHANRLLSSWITTVFTKFSERSAFFFAHFKRRSRIISFLFVCNARGVAAIFRQILSPLRLTGPAGIRQAGGSGLLRRFLPQYFIIQNSGRPLYFYRNGGSHRQRARRSSSRSSSLPVLVRSSGYILSILFYNSFVYPPWL